MINDADYLFTFLLDISISYSLPIVGLLTLLGYKSLSTQGILVPFSVKWDLEIPKMELTGARYFYCYW
jgi:hypothetical protein